jgi:hypothetical protein
VLEKEIPEHRRQFLSIDDRGSDIGKNDDPRWTEMQAVYDTVGDRREEIAWSFVDRPPTTVAGFVALFKYAAEHARVNDWPDGRFRFSYGRFAGRVPEIWEHSLLKTAGDALPAAIERAQAA